MKQLKFNPDKDMKELEKFNMKFNDETGQWQYKALTNEWCFINSWNGLVKFTRGAHISTSTCSEEILILYYDLIKANLLIVESDEDEKRM